MDARQDKACDEWLVLRSQDGDAEAFGLLVARWQPRLLRHARRLLGAGSQEADAAHEAVQEAWLAIVRGMGRLEDPARFRTWTYRIVSRRCVDRFRRRHRDRQLTETVAREAARDAPKGPPPDSPDHGLCAALRRLDPMHRCVLELRYLDGLNVREVAEALGIPVGTVKSRLFHARDRLKRAMETERNRE